MDTHELIIIGAGAMGSAATYHAAKAGLNPLLLEQFEVGHSNGSSHGGSRITRYANPDIEESRVIPATFRMWRELEQESGQRLLDITGSLFMGPDSTPFLVDTRAALQLNEYDYRDLSSQELATEYPQFNLPDDWVGLYQADAGRLNASSCVRAMVDQAIARGAQLKENTEVAQFVPDADCVMLALSNGEQFYTKRLIITAGPWASRVLNPLPNLDLDLRITRQQVAYYPLEQEELYRKENFPVYVFAAEPNLYGFPILEKPGHVKIALENENLTTNPDDPRAVMEDNAQALNEAVAKHFNGVVPEPASIETCLYTETPGRKFIVERHPDFANIAYGAGFSGRGFKFSIEIGRQLVELVEQ
ncbi:MAG: N-methyl-L-tryptophan oxidase [Pseudomonadales bacterium]|nr:N-methyl-L-tryptophan oxidase [Pseudomonadales bacterium]